MKPVVLLVAFSLTAAPAAAQTWKVEKLVSGSSFHGVHGLGIDDAGRLFAGSVVGQALYQVDIRTGAVTTAIGPVQGMADDIAFAPDGTMAWTGFLTGDLYARKGDGPIQKLASGLPGINSLAYRKDGRLYATQVFLGDALYEIDTAGAKPPRKIMEGMGGLNGFEFGSDDKLYGPLWFKGQIARIDVDTGKLDVVMSGFKTPAAVNFDPEGRLLVVDTATGRLTRIDLKKGTKARIARLKTSLDNLAVARDGRIFVSNMADNGIQEVDPAKGSVRQVVKGRLAMPGGIALARTDGRDTLYLADLFAYRAVDPGTGRVTDIARMHAAGSKLHYPFSATVNGNHVVLSSWFESAVQVYDRETGGHVRTIQALKAPYDAIELPDGSILVAEYAAGNLTEITGRSGADRKPLTQNLGGPLGLVRAGNVVYVTENLTGQVSRIDLKTGTGTVVAKGLAQPEGIARAPDGGLIVAEVGARRVVRIDPKTGAITPLAGDLPIGLAGLPGMPPAYVPTGVAVDGAGRIYVTSDIENALYRLSRK
jgi:sugar lactone lactonase YvrE